MEKIKINKISAKAKKQKGFSEGPFAGCLNCPCGPDRTGGACCKYGCDVDKESFDLIYKNRDLIEPVIERKFEDCFDNEWMKGNYLGGSGVGSLVREEDGFCIFHKKGAKGCWLVDLVIRKGLPRRLIPTICRIYPLTWTDEGELILVDDGGEDEIEPGCDCNSVENKTDKNILETQKEELEDIFDIEVKYRGGN